ncbi:hypothetical protein AB0M39_40965 [Streptomyces sp. NPDC051907]|uniref:hypothetical protein n=1 Tax=Streptomyces sp. NPDC051907 TaxID=3155284 RepID=UPI003440FA05
MATPETDYTPGDEPVPVGTVVRYTGSRAHGEYEITEHRDPAEHPRARLPLSDSARAAYPDGTAYDLWPVGVERKFGNRDRAVYYARRTSFTVVSPPAQG